MSDKKTTIFHDTEGRAWDLKVTTRSYMALHSELDVNIDAIFDKKQSWLSDIVAGDNMPLLLNIITLILRKQIKDAGLTDQDLWDAMDGDTVNSATQALVQGIVSFLPAHKRRGVELMSEQALVGMEMIVSRLEIEAKRIEKVTRETISTAMDKAVEEHLSSDSSGRQPESSE